MMILNRLDGVEFLLEALVLFDRDDAAIDGICASVSSPLAAGLGLGMVTIGNRIHHGVFVKKD